MRKTWVFTLILLAACSSKNSYNPDEKLDLKEQSEFVNSIIRYIARLPERANDSTKFNEKFDEHYQEQLSKHVLKLYHRSSGDQFFLITRRAPSLFEKYVAIGGRLRVDDRDNITEYEEVFRTWKMEPDTLSKRAALLFDRMVKGESLEPYLTRNSKGVEYIEFPDENVYYDKASRKWKSTQFGSIEEMIDEQ